MNYVDADLTKLIGVEKMLRFQRVHLMQFEQKRFVSAHQLIFEAAQKEYGVCIQSQYNKSDKDQNSDIKLKFVFSKKATKIDEIFTVDLTLTT